MGKIVIYDFIESPAPGSVIDGSDDMLPADERVTEADLASPLAGSLRDMQRAAGAWPPDRPSTWGLRVTRLRENE